MAIYLYVSRRGVHHYGAREFTPVPALESIANGFSFSHFRGTLAAHSVAESRRKQQQPKIISY